MSFRGLDGAVVIDEIGPAGHRMYLESDRVLMELCRKVTEDSLALLPKLLSFLKHDDPNIVKQSITTGTSLFCAVLAEIALQLNKSNRVERWLEKMWSWMLQFKDAIFGIFLEPGSVGAKLVAIKFLETCVLCFTSDENVGEVPYEEGNDKEFNVSCLLNGHPVFNKASLITEANNALKLLLDLVQSAGFLQGSLTITAVNCLAAIARNRELHYDAILSSLLGLAQNGEASFGGHISSVRYSLRTALVGFLKCNHPSAVESRETLIKCLRLLSPGEAIEQVIRQMEKISRTERINRDGQVNRDDQPSGQALTSGEMARIRSGTLLDDVSVTEEGSLKRMRLNTTFCSIQPGDKPSDFMDTSVPTIASKSDLSPVGKMIAMIGALLAEGERGSESLEILISNIHSDLLADIVLETMKHLPSIPLSSFTNNGNMRLSSQISPRGSLSQLGSPLNTNNGTYSSLSSNLESTKVISSESSMSTLDAPALSSLLTDFKRDPRRDPRRFDPRLAAAPIGQPLASNLEASSESKNDAYHSSGNLILPSEDKVEYPPACVTSICGGELLDRTVPTSNQLATNESVELKDKVMELEPEIEVHSPSKVPNSAAHAVSEEVLASTPSDATESESIDGNAMEPYHCCSPVSTTPSSEDASHDMSKLPLQVELTVEQEKALCKLAILRIFKDCKQVCDIACNQPWLPLLARVVAQNEADDAMISLLQGHITMDCDRQRGHELAMHLLYYIHALMLSESSENSTFAESNYERFLLSIAKSFLDSLPASDKSFSRLLGEAPFLPGSVLRLLEDVCCSSAYDHLKKESDGDRVTQGLGAIWSLILYRPSYRKACLDIALKCAVHEKEEVRTKAIRLVVNKLYLLSYASENIENFARRMLLSLVDDQVLESELKYASSSVQRTASPVVQETEGCTPGSSISVSQGVSESDSMKHSPSSSHNAPSISLSQAQQKTSLYFALCSKKPNLFKLVFDIYGRASKAIKQSIHRHVPIMLRNLGPSSNVLQYIISDPPEGCENLISLVLQVITEETTASADLIAAVKHLYGTRMKDAAILIPILPSLSKDEVLPIFPRLVDLPIEKFQAALACILQGSAHTGPALTPVEVLNSIHDINPDKDGIALKKITEACTACFEQRTVFTQQVLEKSLNCLVDKTPLPLLLMRTVIQTIDAFPSMVDFIMVILSRLVIRQIWRMPKLWVGFLKCASQTMPHSCSVLLELPAPQLEAALNKHPDMRVRLASFANQPSIRNSLSSQTLRILGLIQDEE
ncbi:hypothetical protein HPP92_023324 [Vanilla planifolia]|uniref:Symplekin n=1 Tax=Vanilla planifolia TaxID=51239 RepID=A0A835PQR7_VANPL|nr:hypothetical protein HPP92_023652 [Vanilla planifolia]KAG0460196.1 hypothetical protein HPP92_023324 [Vanilla planifolia]